MQVHDAIDKQLPRAKDWPFYTLPVVAALLVMALRQISLNSDSTPSFTAFLILLACLSAATSILSTIRPRGQSRQAWTLIAVASISFGFGLDSVTSGSARALLNDTLFFVSLTGAALLLCYVRLSRGEKTKLALDLFPPVAAFGVMSWVFVVGPRALDATAPAIDKLSAAVHGAGQVALLSLAVAGLLSERRRTLPPSAKLVLIGLSVIACASALRVQGWSNGPWSALRFADGMMVGAFCLIAASGLSLWLTPQPGVEASPAAERGHLLPWSNQIQNVALGGLLVLAGEQSIFDETVPSGITVAVAGALAMLLYFIVRESVIMHRERHLHQEIGKLSQRIDGLISQVGRDPLTGLLNHWAIHERLDHELANGRETGQAVAVILIDVDNFKSVNDTLGHQAGDRVLHAVASVLTAACRGSDVAARYAGDEFMLVLPGLNEAFAAAVGARIADEVRRVNDDLKLGRGILVSLSIGVAVTHRCQRSMAQTVAIADAAMYDAKEGGKNRVVVVNADTLVITEPVQPAKSVDEVMALTLVSPDRASAVRRLAG